MAARPCVPWPDWPSRWPGGSSGRQLFDSTAGIRSVLSPLPGSTAARQQNGSRTPRSSGGSSRLRARRDQMGGTEVSESLCTGQARLGIPALTLPRGLLQRLSETSVLIDCHYVVHRVVACLVDNPKPPCPSTSLLAWSRSGHPCWRTSQRAPQPSGTNLVCQEIHACRVAYFEGTVVDLSIENWSHPRTTVGILWLRHEWTRHAVRIPIEVVYPGHRLLGSIRGATSRGETSCATWPAQTPRSARRAPIHGTVSEWASARGRSLPRPQPMSQFHDVRTHPQAATAGIFKVHLDLESSESRGCLNETRHTSGDLA